MYTEIWWTRYNIGYNFDGCQNQWKMRGGPSAEKVKKKFNSYPVKQKMTRKSNSRPDLQKIKRSHFRTNFVVKKKVGFFTSQRSFWLHFLKEMIALRLKKTIPMWWRCSRSCSVYSQPLFLYKVDLTVVKRKEF